jgi:2-polyprenyl-6-methoxyphenol hydroxylase-like FAD-dependent oxidoreductase
MTQKEKRQKAVVIGAGPVGALAALYAAQRGHDVEVYELRSGTSFHEKSSNYSIFKCQEVSCRSTIALSNEHKASQIG